MDVADNYYKLEMLLGSGVLIIFFLFYVKDKQNLIAYMIGAVLSMAVALTYLFAWLWLWPVSDLLSKFIDPLISLLWLRNCRLLFRAWRRVKKQRSEARDRWDKMEAIRRMFN